ncbi:MAG: hypothetical protein PHT44_01640 [Candidatus Portnoybacteria bacterium]|nr:hypothetical protein [Candidatus Portnoybacteria bacterium]MDD4982702.1 hypothetical protein [Candidatus Portnoybacteria bacterium]
MPAFILAPNEQIILTARRHWFFMIVSLLKAVALALVPWLIAFALAFFDLSLANQQAFATLFWYFAWLFWLLCFCWGVLIWLDWYLDIWVLTNQKIIDIQQMGLFKRLIMTYGIDNIQGVTTRTSGPFSSLLKYGDAEIKIAGQADAVAFKQIPQPQMVQDKILQAHQDYLKNMGVRAQL